MTVAVIVKLSHVMRVILPLLDHLVDGVKEAKQALAHNVDSINKRSKYVKPAIAIVKLGIAFLASC